MGIKAHPTETVLETGLFVGGVPMAVLQVALVSQASSTERTHCCPQESALRGRSGVLSRTP